MNVGKIAQELQKALDDKNKRKTSPYDTPATVVKVDGDTLWVHIPGGVDETPVKRTIDAQSGDTVLVHIENGGAWATGNSSRPPTDDAKATVAVTMATTADLKAADAKVAATEAINTAQAVQSEIEDVQTDIEIAQGEISEINSDITELQSDVSTAQGDISTIQGNITTLHSNVSAAQGDISTIQGNITTLQSNVSDAQGNITTIQGNITSINGQISSINSDIDDIESDVTGLSGRVSTAEGKVITLEGQVSTAQTNIQNLQGRISTAETNITNVEQDIDGLETRVAYAEDDIDDTLKGLALAQDVIGAVNWLTAHSTVTTDTTPMSGTTYYIKNQDNTFTIVTDTTGKNPAQEGWYVMDEAVSNYVATHLALTDSGLYVAADDSDWKVLIADDGVYIIDASSGINKIVASYSDTVTIGENRTGKTRTEIDSSGMHIYRNASGTDTLVAHLGYAQGRDKEGGTSTAPYYTLGRRKSGSTVGNYSVAEGSDIVASGFSSHAEGYSTSAIGDFSHAEGSNTYASAYGAHAEGYSNSEYEGGIGFIQATGIGAHAEGSISDGTTSGTIIASGIGAHAEGSMNILASGIGAHSEGHRTSATGDFSHAEGNDTDARGVASHAEGNGTNAWGDYSHARGNGTVAYGRSITVLGEYNLTHPSVLADRRNQYVVIVGNGDDDDHRSDALTLDWNGNLVTSGSITDGNGNILSNKVDSSVLSAVATSGSYADLSGKPTNVSAFTNDAGYISSSAIPTNVSAFTNDAGYITSYTETDPTVPAWAKASTKPSYSASEISGLSTVATSGSYTDLSGKPTNVSDFTNDAGYISSETDPTVPAWAKAATKPSYSASEISGLSAVATSGSYADLLNLPVDYVTSQGTSSSWYYRKWNSGKVEAWYRGNVSCSATSTTGNVHRSTYSLTIPSGIFSSAPIINLAIDQNASTLMAVQGYASSKTAISGYVFRSGSSSDTYNTRVSVYAWTN